MTFDTVKMAFKEALDISDEKNIYMFLVDSNGKALWHVGEYARLKRRRD